MKQYRKISGHIHAMLPYLVEISGFNLYSFLTGQCEVFQKISFLYELKPLQALTYTTCKPGPDENHSQTLKPLSDGHSLKNFALSRFLRHRTF